MTTTNTQASAATEAPSLSRETADLLQDLWNFFDGPVRIAPTDENARAAALWKRIEKLLAAPSPPAATEAPSDAGTPGPWFVRKRERDGVLLDCFVAAPDCLGFAYDAEILGDDEYRETPEDEDAGIKRKLADCELIVAAVNAHRAAPTPPTSEKPVCAGLSDEQIEERMRQQFNEGRQFESDRQAALVSTSTAAAARHAYFGASRHGVIAFDKLPAGTQAAWRKVAEAVLAAQAKSEAPQPASSAPDEGAVAVAYSNGRTLHWHAGRGITDAQLYAGPVQPVQASLSDEQVMHAIINACDSLNITRVHGIGGPTRTICDEAGLLEIARAVLALASSTPTKGGDHHG